MKFRECAFKVENLNIAKMVNALVAKGIACKKLKTQGNSVTFVVANKNCISTQRILTANNINFEILWQNSHKLFLQRLLGALGMVVGMACSVALIFVGSLVCYDYRVDCSDEKITKQVELLLKENNLNWRLRKDIDLSEIENKMRDNIKQLAFVQLYYDGGTLVVQVVAEHPEFVPKPIYKAIVASEDCVISSIKVFGGTAMVKVGDVVQKGQVLIAGYIQIGDPADPESIQQPCEADGEVLGLMWEHSRLELMEQSLKLVDTGNKVRRVEINIFGWKWSAKKTCDYTIYSTKTVTKTFGALFPIKYTATEYIEKQVKEESLTQIDIDKAISEEQQRIFAQLKSEQKVCRDWKIEKRLDNLYIIDIYYELETAIGTGVA